MTTTPPPGSEGAGAATGGAAPAPPIAASFGGPGWRPRDASHAEEVAAGSPWGRIGVRSEVAPLRAVLLVQPGEELRMTAAEADAWLLLEPPDVPALVGQAEAAAAFYVAQGIVVHRYRPDRRPPPNLLFARDLFAMTPEGAILGRMASRARAGEERFAAEALARAGVPILHTVRGRAVFEGADLLWLAPDLVLVGQGLRTNAEGCAQVERVVAEVGARVIPIPLPAATQHLLGVVNPIDRDLAAVRADAAPPELRRALADAGVRALDLEPDDEVVRGRAMNFVTLAPRRLVMPTGCPATRRRYEAAGVECHELDVGEYLKAAGAMGCFTGVIARW